MIGFVYVGLSECRKGLKIGYSSDPEMRAKAISYTMNKPFVLLHTERVADAAATENMAHWELRVSHISHEWFDVTLDQAKVAILKAVERVSAGEIPPLRVGVARPFNAEAKDCRISLHLSESETEALDDWRAERHIWSRSEAVRQLIASSIRTAVERELARREE